MLANRHPQNSINQITRVVEILDVDLSMINHQHERDQHQEPEAAVVEAVQPQQQEDKEQLDGNPNPNPLLVPGLLYPYHTPQSPARRPILGYETTSMFACWPNPPAHSQPLAPTSSLLHLNGPVDVVDKEE
jgi:hypothetical protein